MRERESERECDKGKESEQERRRRERTRERREKREREEREGREERVPNYLVAVMVAAQLGFPASTTKIVLNCLFVNIFARVRKSEPERVCV